MPSSREDPTPTNYNVKVDSRGFNIPEIDLVVVGDTLTFINEDSQSVALSFSPELGGLTGVTMLSGRRWLITVAPGDGDCEIKLASLAADVGETIKLTIKVGGRTEKR